MLHAQKLALCKINDASKYLPHVDPADADADFRNDVSKNSANIYAITYDEEIVGLASIQDDSESYIYVYIFPAHRNQGYGTLAVTASEQYLRSAPLLSISTVYNIKNEIARQFAEKRGYVKKFTSSVMAYPGPTFDLPDLPIQKHRDEYFIEAYTMSAEAFHIMRLETGHDPNSVPYEPDEEIRQYCLETAENRYLYLLDNEVVGCAYVDGAEIANVSIKISHQGKGLGKTFVKYLVNEILEKQIGQPYLFCLGVNKKARQLYDSLGFQEVTCNAYATKTL